MNFILFLLSLIGNYIFFPFIIGLLAILIPHSMLFRFIILQIIIISIIYGFIVGFITNYFMTKPSVSFQWLYIIMGIFFSLGLVYRLQSITGQAFRISDMPIAILLWIFSIGSFILTLIIF